ncbi:MAG: inositol monophosphatase [Candidatus Thermoplasmatota archaeon]|nr:inositol monophosphatase [Euryarchaeota archaeon]MBU4031456.1 inositol monophosphatase [Candidatus Thermoplasmatota archaeon]MBU4071891.1 inositol monophosphatase [Candidatus Thermoplasmatota archaeon]MBU4143447.1 inositol monophosphatase [Candidatus Thermoplasmatota archaeon]MBU4592637.1 inositol monophosphatase [Candidatus Thermoplasmatota archaeon]
MMNHLLEMARTVRTAVAGIPLEERRRTVAMGADGTPTSYIDKVAEDAILEYMKIHDIRLNFLSEEAGFIDWEFEDTLVVDPLDGTFNACSGIPFYSVSLAVGRDSLSGMTEGLVMNLVTGDCFRASEGGGAMLNDQPIKVRAPADDKTLITYLGASARPRAHAAASRFRRVRCLGSVSLEICAVACGQVDAFFIDYSNVEKSPRVIDIAAAVLILREAGGQAYDANGEILNMPLSLDVRKNMAAVNSTDTLELIL